MLISLTSFSALPTHVIAAKFFKWTDENGNTHYSDKAPDGVESPETVHVSSKKRSGDAAEAARSNVQSQNNNREQEDNSPEALAEKEKQEKALAEYCQSLQSNIKALQIGGRIQTVDAAGNKKFLDEKEQQQKLDQYLNQHKESCN